MYISQEICTLQLPSVKFKTLQTASTIATEHSKEGSHEQYPTNRVVGGFQEGYPYLHAGTLTPTALALVETY